MQVDDAARVVEAKLSQAEIGELYESKGGDGAHHGTGDKSAIGLQHQIGDGSNGNTTGQGCIGHHHNIKTLAPKEIRIPVMYPNDLKYNCVKNCCLLSEEGRDDKRGHGRAN